jgi:hypothetical protein
MTTENLRMRQPDQYGHWGLEVIRRVPTTDSARRAGDTLLTAVELGSAEERAYTSRTGPMIGLDLGVVWDGSWPQQLDRMDSKAAKSAIVDRMVRLGRVGGRDAEIAALANYLMDRDDPLASSESRPGPSGTTTFGTSGRLEREFGKPTTPAELQGALDEHWSEAHARPNAYASDSAPMDPRKYVAGLGRPVEPRDINAINRAHWAAQARPQPYDRRWGRG